MGYKTKGSYKSFCIKNCMNRDVACKACFKYSKYKPEKKDLTM